MKRFQKELKNHHHPYPNFSYLSPSPFCIPISIPITNHWLIETADVIFYFHFCPSPFPPHLHPHLIKTKFPIGIELSTIIPLHLHPQFLSPFCISIPISIPIRFKPISIHIHCYSHSNQMEMEMETKFLTGIVLIMYWDFLSHFTSSQSVQMSLW